MKYYLMIACLYSLPIGLAMFSLQSVAANLQSQQSQQQATSQAFNPTEDVRPLIPETPVEREISGSNKHIYQVSLKAGQFVQASLQQKGIDAIVLLYGSNGKILQDFVDPVYENRTRNILFIAQSDSDYYLVVRPRQKDSPSGRYIFTLELLRSATENDKNHVRASQITEDANRTLRRANAINLEDAKKINEKFEEAIKLWNILGDNLEIGKCLQSTGILYRRAGEYSKALEFYEKSLPYFPNTTEGLGATATTLNNIAELYLNLGETRRALDVFQKSLELKNNEDGRSRAITLDNIGAVYVQLGDYQQALYHHLQALARFRALGNHREEAVTLNNLALLWESMGDPEKSVEFMLQALPVAREYSVKDSEALYLSRTGYYYFLTGNNLKALEYANQSLALSRAINNHQREVGSLAILCNVYPSMGEFEKGLDACNRALQMQKDNGEPLNKAKLLTSLSRIFEQTGEIKKAIESRESALSIYRSVGDPTGELTTLHALGQYDLDSGDLVSARGRIERALEMAESMRINVGSLQLRSTYMAGRQRIYESYLDLLMRMHIQDPGKGYDRIALQISERARARSLLDLLAEGRAKIRQGADALVLEKERSLLERLKAKDDALKKLRNDERTKRQAESVANEINELTTQLQLIESQIRSSSPRYAALTKPEPLDANEIQKQTLDENTVLLEYSLGEKQSWLWAVTKDSISSHKLPPRVEIETSARLVYEMLTARQSKKDLTEEERLKKIAEADLKLQAETTALSRTLLGPVSEQLRLNWKGKRLAFVTSGALEYLPFAALPSLEPDRRSDAGKMQTEDKIAINDVKRLSLSRRSRVSKSLLPSVITSRSLTAPASLLITNHEIVNLPSASALALIRREASDRNSANKTLAVLADPVFEYDDPRLSSAKKKASQNNLIAGTRSADSQPIAPSGSSALARSVRSFQSERFGRERLSRDGFGRLVFSNEEAEYITGFAPRGSTLKAIGFNANRQLAASGELGRYRIVHFATHGLINGEHPELSGLVLSLVDENGKPQDGFLRMHEIFDLRLPADLVVLSACQTALGKEIKGEGLVGLTRGFMYAGAERVAASLWQVDDEATAQLMRLFYRGMLKENLRPVAALRSAQVEMSKSSRWSSPYYWAGFVIQGEWR